MKVEIQKISSEILKDAYDRLVMKFLHFNKKGGCNIFVFTGSGIKADATAVARNVAVQMAETGNNTLYIDACFIKCKDAILLVNSYTEGILDYLVDANIREDIFHSTNVKNLDFISCGFAENPASLFASKKFDAFLKRVSEKYDYIFLDTPPLEVTVGAAIISSKASGVVVVTEFNKTKKKQIAYATEELESIGANVMGVVMNNVNSKFYKRFVGNYKVNKEKYK